MALQKPAAIFFDWDGTLIDSLNALHSYYNHVNAVFDKPVMTIEDARRNIRKSAREIFPEIFGEQSDEALQVYFDIAQKTHLDHLTPFLGAKDMIAELKERGIDLGVISNKRHDLLLREVDALGWSDYFRAIVGAGVAKKDKPAPDPLLLAADYISKKPDEIEMWYVGDTETDMQAAQAAGFQPIFIEHGLGKREDCISLNAPLFFVNNFTELSELIKKTD